MSCKPKWKKGMAWPEMLRIYDLFSNQENASKPVASVEEVSLKISHFPCFYASLKGRDSSLR